MSSFIFFAFNQFYSSFVKGLHHQSYPYLLLVSYFFYMPATMKSTRRENVFFRQRRLMIFLQVTHFYLIFAGPSEILLAVILIITFLHNFAFSAGTFYLALFFQVRSWLYVINICLAHIINRQLLELRPWNPESKVYLTPLGRPWHLCRWLGSLGTGNDGLMTQVVRTG